MPPTAAKAANNIMYKVTNTCMKWFVSTLFHQKKVFLRGIAIKYGDGINKYLPKYVINCPQNNR